MSRLTDRLARGAGPTIETLGRRSPVLSIRTPSMASGTVTDAVTGVDAPAIPMPEFARRITAAEEIDARAKGRRSTTPGWRALATRGGAS